MPRVWNTHDEDLPDGCVEIGRPTQWGNPYITGRDGNREQVIAKFEWYLRHNPELVERAKRELRGRDLVCYCKPLPCHGDVLLRIANEV